MGKAGVVKNISLCITQAA